MTISYVVHSNYESASPFKNYHRHIDKSTTFLSYAISQTGKYSSKVQWSARESSCILLYTCCIFFDKLSFKCYILYVSDCLRSQMTDATLTLSAFSGLGEPQWWDKNFATSSLRLKDSETERGCERRALPCFVSLGFLLDLTDVMWWSRLSYNFWPLQSEYCNRDGSMCNMSGWVICGKRKHRFICKYRENGGTVANTN